MNKLGTFLANLTAPTPQPGPVVGTPAATPSLAATNGNPLAGINFVGLIFQYWYVALILLIVLFFLARYGINKGWEALIFRHNSNQDPFPPLGDLLKRLTTLMYKEDYQSVFTNVTTGAVKFEWLTWKKFWLMDTIAIIVSLLSFLILPPSTAGILFGLFVFIGLLGIKHIRYVFNARHRTLMQMFEVANAEMRFLSGANLNPWGYVIITEWVQIYSPGTTYIMFPAKFRSDSLSNRTAFETHFNGTVTESNTWTYTWEPSNNRVIAEPVPHIESTAGYPFPDKHPWNEFPLGISSGGNEAQWDVSVYPHCLIAGTTGSGKSVTQRTMLLHALQSPDWRIVLVDPKRVELSGYRGHPNVLRVATELDDSLDLIDQVEREMQSRYVRMQEAGETQGRQVSHFKELTSPPPALLLMVDETFALLSPTGIKSDEGKAQDEMKARIGILLGQIARLGRAAGVHMILATQRPDAKVLPGEVKANLDARIAQGRMDTTPSLMTLDSDAATKIPPIKGRAILRTGQLTTEFQAYFLPPEQLPMVLEMAAAIAQGESSFLDFDEPEMEPRKKGFSLPQINLPQINLPHGFQARISAWVEKRKAIIAENEELSKPGARKKKAEQTSFHAPISNGPGRPQPLHETIRPQQDEDFYSYEDEDDENFGLSEAEKPADISSVAQQARERGFSSNPADLFVVADAPRVHTNYTAPILDDTINSDYDDDPFTEDDLIRFDEPSSATLTQTQDASPKQVNVPDQTPTVTPLQPTVSVQEVMRRAQQRGVPIPASELLAALRAEVARDEAMKNASAEASQETDPVDDEVFEPEPGSAAYYQLHKDDIDEWTEEELEEEPEEEVAPPVVMERPAPVRPDPSATPTIPAPPIMVDQKQETSEKIVETAVLQPVMPQAAIPEPPARPQGLVDALNVLDVKPAPEASTGPARVPRRPKITPTQIPLEENIATAQPLLQEQAPAPVITEKVEEEDSSWDEAPWMPKTIIQPHQDGPSPFGLPNK